MAKLTKAQTRRHNEALALLRKDKLTDDEREQVCRDFHPGANHMTGVAGAFFTPLGLANDLTIDGRGDRILDLCAGIGALSLPQFWRSQWCRRDREALELTCVEINPTYVEIGRKLVPWARWICADVFDITPAELGSFDCVISNPPFGRVPRSGKGPRYTGADFEFHVIDIAAQFAPYGAFILPSMSAPFTSEPYHQYRKEGRALDFIAQTGIRLDAGCGIDCRIYRDEWVDASPSVEVVCAEFEDAKPIKIAAPAPALAPITRQLDLLAAE